MIVMPNIFIYWFPYMVLSKLRMAATLWATLTEQFRRNLDGMGM